MKLNVVFLHPDLGIGGAERLVIDAAVAMKECGHSVQFITNHHSPTHCFEETRDGTVPVTVVGNWLPRTVLGKCYALCSYLRMMYAALYLTFFGNVKPDVVFVDQVSACVPILKWMPCKVLFYCHYPDQLLAAHDSHLRFCYRMLLDWLEEYTMRKADRILVNSRFTLGVFMNTFPSINKQPDVVYPSINSDLYAAIETVPLEDILNGENCTFLLSINRFERKKSLDLAIRCLNLLHDKTVKLIVAGGYDPLNRENIEYFQELVELVEDMHLNDRVIFLKSPSEAVKISLLRHCLCVIYTPSNEHFGIVPLEAMYCGKPVVATDSGGPKETIQHLYNGFLCKPEPKSFAKAVTQLLETKEIAEKFGKQGQLRFDDFSFIAFKTKINNVLHNLYRETS